MVLSPTCDLQAGDGVGEIQNKTAQRTDNELKSI